MAKKKSKRRPKKKRRRAPAKKKLKAVPRKKRRSPSSVPSVPPARPTRAGGGPSPSSPAASALAKLAVRHAPSRGEIDAILPGLAQALRGVPLLLELAKLTTHQMTVLVKALAPLQARLPQAVLVEAYGHSRKMLSAWQKDGAARNADANKTWDHPTLDKFLRERWKAQRTQQLPLEVNWEERLKKARALAAERDYSLSQGRLVSRDLVERLFSELAQVLKRSLRRLPELAARVVRPDGKAASETVARELLASYRDQAVAELSRMAVQCAQGLEDEKGASS